MDTEAFNSHVNNMVELAVTTDPAQPKASATDRATRGLPERAARPGSAGLNAPQIPYAMRRAGH